MANAENTNPNVVVYGSADTCPILSSALTGTFTAAANGRSLVGTGTLLTTQISSDALNAPSKDLGYLVDMANLEVRKIENIWDATHLTLNKGFSNAQAGTTLRWCPSTGYSRIQLTNVGGSTTVNGSAVGSAPFSIENAASAGKPCEPVLIANCCAIINF